MLWQYPTRPALAQLLPPRRQAAANGKIVARETLKTFRKNVLAKCYGGDVSRWVGAGRCEAGPGCCSCGVWAQARRDPAACEARHSKARTARTEGSFACISAPQPSCFLPIA